MAWWFELRCDDRRSKNCWSKRNEGPMTLTGPTQTAVTRGLERLVSEAHEQGWRKVSGRWFCPACYETRKRKT